MKLFILIFFILVILPCKADLIINEFMPAPDGDEPEWIEIYNPDSTAHDVPDMRVCDLLNCTSCSLYVEPYSYLIITPKPKELNDIRNLPDGVPIVKVSFPGLNNTYDAITLKNKDGIIYDSAYYDMDYGERGISFERISVKSPAYGENLKMSNNPSGATPGFRNSISPIDFDAGIDDVQLKNNYLQITIINYGERNFETSLNCLINEEKIFDENVFIKDTAIVNTGIVKYTGSQNVKCIIHSNEDKNQTNDTLLKTVNFPPSSNALTFSEIMFDVDDKNAEYAEIYNRSDSEINLKDFSIHDEAKLDDKGAVIDSNFFIQPESFAILCWDEMIFDAFPYIKDMDNIFVTNGKITLNKTNDIIVLKSSSGNTLDSLRYQNDWHNSSLLNTQNISLEKVSTSLNSEKRDNWASCTDESGGTPGIENSVNQNTNDEKRISIKPNPFSPSVSGGISECYITYNYEIRDASVTAKIYDRNGAMLRELKNNENSHGSGIIKWDGKNDKGYKLPPAPYILIFQLKNNETDNIHTHKEVIVLGK